MKPLLTLSLLASVALLTGCIDRDTADNRLAKACAAAVEAFLPTGEKIDSVNNKTFGGYDAVGQGYRQVKLDISITDGFHGYDEATTCVFLEEFGIGRMSHDASIYKFEFNGETYGQDGYEIQGSLQDMTKLTNAIDAALK